MPPIFSTAPGVGPAVAEALVAEIGLKPSRFPSAQHLASWAGLCPGNHESGGKRRGGATRKGSPWLRACLVPAAHAAARTKGTYLAAQYRRLAARRGRAKAAVAVAHSILIIVSSYQPGREQYFQTRLAPSRPHDASRQIALVHTHGLF